MYIVYQLHTPGKLKLFKILIILSFNQLDLPEYHSKEMLYEKLVIAITEGKEGFGFAWRIIKIQRTI